jgi:hypothetical protein
MLPEADNEFIRIETETGLILVNMATTAGEKQVIHVAKRILSLAEKAYNRAAERLLGGATPHSLSSGERDELSIGLARLRERLDQFPVHDAQTAGKQRIIHRVAMPTSGS